MTPHIPATRSVSPWGAIATWALLIGCGSASVAANWAGAQPHFLARILAAAPPAVYLVCVEVLLRADVPKLFRYSGTQFIGISAVAAISAYASYVHQVELLLSFGEPSGIAHTLPIALDGAMLLASVTLLGIAAQKRAVAERAAVPARGTCRHFLGIPAMPPRNVPPAGTPSEQQVAAAVPAHLPANVPARAGTSERQMPARAARHAARAGTENGTDAGTGTRHAARQYIRQRHAEGVPVTGTAVAEKFGMSERWGRNQIKEAMASA